MKTGLANTKGKVEELHLDAPRLHRDKKIWVYLPYGYDITGMHYSVLYMHDGQNVFDHAESFKREWHAAEKLDTAGANSIIVGIEHGGSTHRIDEMTPYTNEKYGGGHADDYLDFVVNILKPHIDKNFRTKANRDNTFIMGASVGGLISFYTLLKFPEIFAKAAVFSPSFWFSEEIFLLIDTVESIDADIYFMAGDHESRAMLPDIERMVTLVREKLSDSRSIVTRIVHGGHHNEKLWRKEFIAAYQWLTANCAAP